MDFFHKGGGGPRQSKSFGTLFVHQPFWNFGQKKGRGVDQIQKFLGTFYPDFGEIWPKKVPQKFQKKSAYKKVSQKFQKSRGVGGITGLQVTFKLWVSFELRVTLKLWVTFELLVTFDLWSTFKIKVTFELCIFLLT